MLSELERIIYTEVLKIPVGQVTSYYSVYDRLLNLVFIPSIVALIFLYGATEPLKNHKGLRFLVILGGIVFSVEMGFYGTFVTLSQMWYLILILVSAFLFVLGMFISRDTKIKLPGKSNARDVARIKAIDVKLRGLYSQKQYKESNMNTLIASLSSAPPANAQMIQNQINKLQNEIQKIDNEINNLIAQRAALVRRASS